MRFTPQYRWKVGGHGSPLQEIFCAGMMAGGAILGAATPHPALSPEESLRTIRVAEGLKVELVAAEPLVVDPVAFAFEPDGRMYVAEGRAYPDPVEQGSGESTLGRIALLTDTDGDGRYDRRTEFAAGLGYVNGIMLWRGGMFVTAAPNILYLKDTDGDGVADERKVVLTGFEATKTAQLRVSHPTLGFDGWVYVTSGLNGGKVTSPLHPERPAVSFNGKDGRFNPDTFEFENTGGRGQFGLAFDAWGRRFITSNRHPVLQVMLEPWVLARNPHFAFSETTQEVSPVEAAAKVRAISGATIAADFIPALMTKPHTGTFTSASGLLVFGGTALGPEYVGSVFVCEPAQNLVQRQVFRPAGAALRSEPVWAGEREFLASTDVWFRPVFAGSAPDGALYVADMNRREIDHPRYIPAESRGLLDFESGKDRGRIYRIVKADAAARADGSERRSYLGSPALALESADEWWRGWAHRTIVEAGDENVVREVEKIARDGRPEARVRALWTLRGLGKLRARVVEAALADARAEVRENAVQLAAELLARGPQMRERVIAAAKDADARVRFCAAVVLGGMVGDDVVEALVEIAVRDGEDRWARAAVLSGLRDRLVEFRRLLQARRGENARAFAAVMEPLGRVFGAGTSREASREFLQEMITGDGELAWRVPATLGLLEGYRTRAKTLVGADMFAVVLGGRGVESREVRAFLESVGRRAQESAAPVSERVGAVALLGWSNFDFAGGRLSELLDARQPAEVQVQAVRALERLGEARGAALLVAKEKWARYTPQVREAVIAALVSRPAMIQVLFEAIRGGVVAAPEISSTRRTQLMKHADAGVKAAAAEIFKNLEGGDRMAVYRKIRDALDPKADAGKGKDVFGRMCSACHTHQGAGGKVGPDLTGVRNQPAEALLLHIVVPNYEVYPAYQSLAVTLKDGRAVTGWLAAETESSLTLRTAAGTEETVLRADVAALVASGVSLMPDGLEQGMAEGEMSALIAFLKK